VNCLPILKYAAWQLISWKAADLINNAMSQTKLFARLNKVHRLRLSEVRLRLSEVRLRLSEVRLLRLLRYFVLVFHRKPPLFHDRFYGCLGRLVLRPQIKALGALFRNDL
jgi:hypothetical protein